MYDADKIHVWEYKQMVERGIGANCVQLRCCIEIAESYNS